MPDKAQSAGRTSGLSTFGVGTESALPRLAGSIGISTFPTISRMATQQAVLLGTAAYLSPEQAKAKSVASFTPCHYKC